MGLMATSLRVRAFTEEQDALLARGWPELRVLTDERVTAKKAASEAVKALWAGDPYLSVEIPREIARQYLRRYGAWRTDARQREAAGATDDGPIDRAWLDVVMERRMPPSQTLAAGGETYEWRLAEVVYLFEAFLGTEVVVSALAAHLTRALEHPEWWDSPDSEASEVCRLAQILGWLRLRMDETRFDQIVAHLAKPEPRLPRYSSFLRLLADRASPLPAEGTYQADWGGEAFAAQRRDATWIEAFVKYRPEWTPRPTQTVAVGGGDLLFLANASKLTRLAKWEQQRIIQEIGAFRHPGSARTIAALLASRATGKEAKEWVLGKREWLEGEALAAVDRKDPAAAAAIRATLEGKEPAPPKPRKELERELRRTLSGVEAKLVAAGGDAKAERAVLDETFQTYCQLRAALGEEMPYAFFTHLLGEQKWKATHETLVRWMDLAVKAATG